MITINKPYKNASAVIVGLAGLILLAGWVRRIAMAGVPYEEEKIFMYWFTPIMSLVTPICFTWAGLLFRKAFPKAGRWRIAISILIIPLIYVGWTLLHRAGYYSFADGERCKWLFCFILASLIPTEQIERFKTRKGWLELALMLASLFIYVGVSRVSNHFSTDNFLTLGREWTRLFSRLMTFLPLAMGMLFLVEFSFSETGQKLGNVKAVGITAQVLAALSFLIHLVFAFEFSLGSLFRAYKILSQPVTLYLITVLFRMIRNKAIKGQIIWHDLFVETKDATG